MKVCGLDFIYKCKVGFFDIVEGYGLIIGFVGQVGCARSFYLSQFGDGEYERVFQVVGFIKIWGANGQYGRVDREVFNQIELCYYCR